MEKIKLELYEVIETFIQRYEPEFKVSGTTVLKKLESCLRKLCELFMKNKKIKTKYNKDIVMTFFNIEHSHVNKTIFKGDELIHKNIQQTLRVTFYKDCKFGTFITNPDNVLISYETTQPYKSSCLNVMCNHLISSLEFDKEILIGDYIITDSKIKTKYND